MAGSVGHNRQHKDLDYIKKDGFLVTWENDKIKNLDTKQLYEYQAKRIAEIDEIIKEKTGRASQVKNHFIEGLISIGRDGFNSLTSNQKSELMEICGQFAQDFCSKHNIELIHCSVHFDEGHYDENGKWQDNAHIQFCAENVNLDTGKAVLSRLTKADFQQLQTDIATRTKHLGFERGENYHAKGEKAPKQEYWKNYKREKTIEQTEKLLEKTKQLEKELATKQNELSAKDKIIAKFKADLEHSELVKDNIKNLYMEARQLLKETQEAKQVDYQELKKHYEQKLVSLSEKEKQLEAKDKTIDELKSEIKEVKTSGYELKINNYLLQSELIRSATRIAIKNDDKVEANKIAEKSTELLADHKKFMDKVKTADFLSDEKRAKLEDISTNKITANLNWAIKKCVEIVQRVKEVVLEASKSLGRGMSM